MCAGVHVCVHVCGQSLRVWSPAEQLKLSLEHTSCAVQQRKAVKAAELLVLMVHFCVCHLSAIKHPNFPILPWRIKRKLQTNKQTSLQGFRNNNNLSKAPSSQILSHKGEICSLCDSVAVTSCSHRKPLC